LRVNDVPREIALSWAGTEEIVAVLPSQPTYWTQFEALSGWTDKRPEMLQLYNVSLDNSQWYLKLAVFSENFARTNSKEDFGSIWELYFKPDSQSEQAPVFDKIEKVDQLFEFIEFF
jgi:hypothetical protein